VDIFHYNRAVAHFRRDAAELVFSPFGAVEIPDTHNHSPYLAEAIDREAIKSETQTPPGVVANRISDTEVPRTNLNRHE
jgi:hypothetical protein